MASGQLVLSWLVERAVAQVDVRCQSLLLRSWAFWLRFVFCW